MKRLHRSPQYASLALSLLALVACNDDGHPRRGAVCAGASECGGLVCRADLDAAPEDLAFLPLSCGDAGEGRGEGEPCADGSQCELGVCALAGYCSTPCADDLDCADGERCQELFARRGESALQPLQACAPSVQLPAAIDVTRELWVGALPNGEVEVDLDATDPGLTTLYVLERTDDLWPDTRECRPGLCVARLGTRDDPPRTLYDEAVDYTIERPRNPVASGPHISPAIVALPSGEPEALSSRGYRVGLHSEASGDLRITRLSGTPSGGELDLNLFYVGTPQLRAEGRRGPPLVAEALEVVDAIFGQAGIAIGEVSQIDVPGELPERGTLFPLGDPGQGFAQLRVRFGVLVELPGLFKLSAGARNAAVNVFFVREIESRAGGDAAGEAGGIPGPAGMHGTAGSGVAIAVAGMGGDATRLGRTLAHELGHYLGLFHTSELDGSSLDPFEDTPECRSGEEPEGDGLNAADCAEHGSDNLMFWAVTSGTTLSPMQRALLRASPLLR